MDKLLRGDVSAYTLPRGLRKVLPLGSNVARARILSFCRRHGVPVREGRRILAKKPIGGVVRTGRFRKYLAWDVAEKDPGKDLLSQKDMENISGPVRDQAPHQNCWSHAATDTFSARRMVTKQDTQFCSFSSKYLTFHVAPGLREKQKEKQVTSTEPDYHLCHPFPLPETFRFMKTTGVPKRYADEDQPYSCVTNSPEKNPPDMYKIEEDVKVPVSNKLTDLYEMLRVQPVAANLHYFYPEVKEIGTEIYYGPTSENSRYIASHAVIITAVRRINKELVAIVKSSHGKENGEGGYFKVSLTRMVVGTGDDNKLTAPSLLLFEFSCPLVAEEAKSSESGKQEKKRKNQTPGFGRESKKSKLAETGASDPPSLSGVPGEEAESSESLESGKQEEKRKNQTPGSGRKSKKPKLAETGASDPPSFSGQEEEDSPLSEEKKKKQGHAKNSGSNSKGKRKGRA